jgi:hypothetical protein
MEAKDENNYSERIVTGHPGASETMPGQSDTASVSIEKKKPLIPEVAQHYQVVLENGLQDILFDGKRMPYLIKTTVTQDANDRINMDGYIFCRVTIELYAHIER